MIRLNVFIQVSEENRPAALETAKELVEHGWICGCLGE